MQPIPLPDGYPSWANELAERYFAGTAALFILHGNVHDLVCIRSGAGSSYGRLADFLATKIFGEWDIVVHYDLANGLRPRCGNDSQRLHGMMQHLAGRLGEVSAWPRDPEGATLALDRLIERNLLAEDPAARKSIAIILDYAQHLVPAGELATQSRNTGTHLVRLLGWAQNPYMKRINTAVCLIADKLAELNTRLVQSPHVAAVEVPMPGAGERAEYIRWATSSENSLRADMRGEAAAPPSVEGNAGPGKPRDDAVLAPEALVALSTGLTLVSLNIVLAQARRSGAGVDPTRFARLKKSMIERQCQGLLEFVEPAHTLDMVVGHTAAVRRLRQDAALIARGLLDAAPMGYLITGPIGTGKTFLAECYAGSIGIPCVKLRNFRSKYVGETEGNLEHLLTTLRSLGPVVVIIDEADAALGTRSAEGDSGTSSRVFAMIAGQMGDTAFRGRIVWMLLTSRPDLLPIDLKRQGRAEVHIPLFYPQDEDEARQMFVTMGRKNKVKVPIELVPGGAVERSLSGADIESVVLAAKRSMISEGRKELSAADLSGAMTDFIPAAQGLEKELQSLASVLECTQLTLLPPEWRERVAATNGRTELAERAARIRNLIEE